MNINISEWQLNDIIGFVVFILLLYTFFNTIKKSFKGTCNDCINAHIFACLLYTGSAVLFLLFISYDYKTTFIEHLQLIVIIFIIFSVLSSYLCSITYLICEQARQYGYKKSLLFVILGIPILYLLIFLWLYLIAGKIPVIGDIPIPLLPFILCYPLILFKKKIPTRLILCSPFLWYGFFIFLFITLYICFPSLDH